MSCCGVTIEAHRNADLRKTYAPRGRNYTFAGFSPLMQIRDGTTVLLTISLSATANGSVFSVVSDALALTLKKADVLALASGPGDRLLSYDIVLSQGGIESWFVGGDFIVLDINATTTEGEQNVTVDLDGQAIDVTIMGGNIGIGASVLLADLNSAVESAEQSANDAAASLAAVPGLATTAGAAAGTTAGAAEGASAGATAGTAAANAVVAGKADKFGEPVLAPGASGWLEALASQTETVNGLRYLSTAGKPLAVIGATRTSNAVAPAYFGSIGVFGFSYNNRARTGSFDTTFQDWAAYFEHRRDAGSGRSHGIEIGSVNIGTGSDLATDADPFNYGQPNLSVGLWQSAGRPDFGTNQCDIPLARGVIENGPPGFPVRYRVGDVWGVGSIKPNGVGISPAWRAPTKYQMEWFTSAGKLRMYIRSDQTDAGITHGVVARDASLDFEMQGVAQQKMTNTSLRAQSTNGGYDFNSTYFPAATATDQWQAQTGGGNLFLNKNTGSTAAPTWSNRGNFNGTTGAYSSVSDRTLKKDFAPFEPDAAALIRGLAGAVSYYTMKDDEDEVQQLGFLAQDLQATLPLAVTGGGGMPLMVSDRPIVAALAKACAFLLEEVEALKKNESV